MIAALAIASGILVGTAACAELYGSVPARNAANSTGKTRTAAPHDPRCIDERILKIDPAGLALHVGTQTYPSTLVLGEREVVLTFDDGPDERTTPRILAALKDACVHATFFLVGRHTHRFPRLAQAEAQAGHTVGHHSNTHPSFTLRGFDEASAEVDIQDGIVEDEEAVYGADATPHRPHVPFFRFPGFADTPQLLRHLDQRGIAVFGSDLWAADWLPMTADHERQRVMALLDQRPQHNGIILFHDTRASTAAMLPALLRELKSERYRVVHLVYAKGAPAPPLTKPLTGESETARIIAHLRKPIVVGSHHLPDRVEPPPGDLGDETEGAPP